MSIKTWLAKRAAYHRLKRFIEEGLSRSLSRKETQMLKKLFYGIFGTSWRTTVAGWAATLGLGNVAGYFKPDGKPNWIVIGGSVFAAIFARLAKDSDVTGGTRPQ